MEPFRSNQHRNNAYSYHNPMPYARYNRIDDVSISKYLCFILRHPRECVRRMMDGEGYVYVEDILNLRKFRGRIELSSIYRIIETDSKRRFSIKYDVNGNAMIRTTQGHSVDVNLGLKLIDDPSLYPEVVHGTTYDAWKSIQTQGLYKMNRAYIHFATGMPGDYGVISGMRNSSKVCIFINLVLAISRGITFFLSENNVILSKGNDLGVIKPCFFLRVVDRRTRECIASC